jgi:hypothetical protein
MNKPLTSALAGLMAISALIPATTTTAEARRGRGLAIGAGVLIGAAALAAAASNSRAYAGERRYYRDDDSGFNYTCRKWLRQCNNGNDYSCEKYETRGCTD